MSTWAFLGDSVTAAGRVARAPDDLGRGWVAVVARRLHRLEPDARAVNLGVSGDRLADVRVRAVEDLRAAGALVPDLVVTLAVGINDVRRAHLDPDPLDPLDPDRLEIAAFAEAYTCLLVDIRAAVPGGAVRFVLVEPVLAPVEESQHRWLTDLDRVVDVVRSTAEATGSVLVGAGQALRRRPAREVTVDGFHPTSAGHALLADAWTGAVQASPALLPRGGRPRWSGGWSSRWSGRWRRSFRLKAH